ncbi:MAG TPA: hypothetical protein EYP36_08055 [Calditrichaeota bacterium]|nr:hypothetical protein [Calditrichota bacterium]
MDENMHNTLRRIHRVNRTLWLGIVSGVFILIAISLFFYLGNILALPVVGVRHLVNQVLMFLVFALLLLIIYIKRNYLQTNKMIERAHRREQSITSTDVIDLVSTFGKEANLLAKTLIIMRRYYMVIWSAADLIVIIGFIQYILTTTFSSFLIYATMGIFSLIINYPRFTIIENLYYKLAE